MSKTSIEWTDFTWNPVSGCTKISPGCKNCYAERYAMRKLGKFSADHQVWSIRNGGNARDREFGDVREHPEELGKTTELKKPHKIFVGSITDIFHDNVSKQFLDWILSEVLINKKHIYQVLTKRTKRMQQYFTDKSIPGGNVIPNLWLGTSVEDQKFADIRIPYLLVTPAAVRWLSIEPLLDDIQLEPLIWKYVSQKQPYNEALNWVVVGGESGPGARPMNLKWVRSLRDQCKTMGIPFFFKQWGSWIGAERVDNDMIRDQNHNVHYKKQVKFHQFDDQYYAIKLKGKHDAQPMIDGKYYQEFPEIANADTKSI